MYMFMLLFSVVVIDLVGVCVVVFDVVVFLISVRVVVFFVFCCFLVSDVL